MGVSDIYFDLQSYYFRHTTPKKEIQNTQYRNKLMLKSLPTEGTKPEVKVVTHMNTEITSKNNLASQNKSI